MTKIAENGEDVYFADLPSLVEGGFSTAAGLGEGWMSFPYRLPGFSGRGLATGLRSPAQPLTLNLNLRGWQRLYSAHNPLMRIWLEGESGYSEPANDASCVCDTEVLCADFTGRKVCIAPVHGEDYNQPLTVFYLRAVPCEPPAPARRNLVATNDGHGIFCQGVDTARDLYRYLYPFKDSDFFRVLWGVYGGGPLTMRQDSEFRDLDPRLTADGCYSEGDNIFARSLSRLRRDGVDPLAVVRQATREYGLELHYYFRMAAFYGPFPHLSWNTRFFLEHPEWHCRDEHGGEVKMLSYAFPEVQDYVLAYFAELLEYQPEGLCLAFNRGLPLMICEEPVLRAYAEKFGRRPKLPEEIDTPELQSVRHELLAGFVARAAVLVRERDASLSCIVPRDFARNRELGLDIEIMLKRGLFESVMVGAGHGDDMALALDIEPVRKLQELSPGTRIFAGGSKSPAHGGAWRCDNTEQAQRMLKILDAGLAGGFVWDTEIHGLDWNLWRHFGTREHLERVAAAELPPKRIHNTLAINDLQVGRYNPWHAY